MIDFRSWSYFLSLTINFWLTLNWKKNDADLVIKGVQVGQTFWHSVWVKSAFEINPPSAASAIETLTQTSSIRTKPRPQSPLTVRWKVKTIC